MVTSLTHSGKVITLTSLLVLLVLEEEKMKRKRIEGTTTNLLMARATAQNLHAPTFHGKPNKFKRRLKEKSKGNL